ncbi:MAG TPA: peptide chain release factor N(5)-glutamine methyltransferase [Spirochaetia bacterium]|nr:peptide chain release factor N(5)-glutamine methyltransferase [Spirochaetia bacterium]
MTVRTLLKQGYDRLFLAEVDTPLLDALLLLAFSLQTTKEKVLASLPEEVSAPVEAGYLDLVDRRSAGTPVSYIRRIKEFWGLEFYVDERVLVPRPDTEALVEKVLEVVRADPRLLRVHDACAGSGCIGISLQSAVPRLSVSASDLSAEAGEVLRLNAEKLLGREMEFFVSDLLEGVPGSYDVITANPPYLSDSEVDDMRKLRWPEPEMALRGGRDGTSVAERLIRAAPRKLAENGWLILEAAPPQFIKLFALMDQAGFQSIDVIQDMSGHNRVIAGRLGPGLRGGRDG